MIFLLYFITDIEQEKKVVYNKYNNVNTNIILLVRKNEKMQQEILPYFLHFVQYSGFSIF